jgi:hypothetical protein
MSEMPVATSQRRSWTFWPHLGVATVFSLLMPYLGSAYLGLKSPKRQTEWQRRALPINLVIVIAIVFPYALNFDLTMLLVFAIGWTLVVAFSIGSLWRAALRRDSQVVVAPDGPSSLIYLLAMIPLIASTILRLDWPEVALFRATEATPTVAAGELLYGLKYTPRPDGNEQSRQDRGARLERGQLILAKIAGKESLARVLAVQGDIFAMGDDALLINGSRVSLRSLTEPWDEYRLNQLVDGLVGSGHSAGENALDRLVQKQAKVVSSGRLLVAREAAFVSLEFGAVVRVYEIPEEDVVLVPWAKFWSLGDHPGTDSDLAQPKYPFFRN